MTRPEKLAAIEKLIKAHDHLTNAQAALDALPVTPEAPCRSVPWEIFDALTDQVAARIGDKCGWLLWFVWEDDCGRKALSAGYDGKMSPIRTPEDLLTLIES